MPAGLPSPPLPGPRSCNAGISKLLTTAIRTPCDRVSLAGSQPVLPDLSQRGFKGNERSSTQTLLVGKGDGDTRNRASLDPTLKGTWARRGLGSAAAGGRGGLWLPVKN